MKLQLIYFITLIIPSFGLELAGSSCRCLPADKCWPSLELWTQLNTTVHGTLIETVPIGTPCHDPHYDAQACKLLQDKWLETELQYACWSPGTARFFDNISIALKIRRPSCRCSLPTRAAMPLPHVPNHASLVTTSLTLLTYRIPMMSLLLSISPEVTTFASLFVTPATSKYIHKTYLWLHYL